LAFAKLSSITDRILSRIIAENLMLIASFIVIAIYEERRGYIINIP